MIREDGEEVGNLPIVALTDGARNLKKEAKEVFGKDIKHMLDWYYLAAKVSQFRYLPAYPYIQKQAGER